MNTEGKQTMSPMIAYQSLHGMAASSDHPRTIYGLSDRLMADVGVTPSELRAAAMLSPRRHGLFTRFIARSLGLLRRLFG